MKKIGIYFNPRREDAINYSLELENLLKAKGIKTWACSAWEPHKSQSHLKASDLVISIGGDGTILRTAKAIIPHPLPILGINLGNLGFMSELSVNQVKTGLESILQGQGWIEERAMLEISLRRRTLYALNDVFIGRRSSARLVAIDCRVNGTLLTTYRTDGLIAATASGSTGYALAAGGPILDPQARDIILIPVAPHFSFDKPLVLPPQSKIELRVTTTHEAMGSVDGQIEYGLRSGDRVKIQLSGFTSKFIRLQPKGYFYGALDSKMNRKIT
jgi:NAD+ kinase